MNLWNLSNLLHVLKSWSSEVLFCFPFLKFSLSLSLSVSFSDVIQGKIASLFHMCLRTEDSQDVLRKLSTGYTEKFLTTPEPSPHAMLSPGRRASVTIVGLTDELPTHLAATGHLLREQMTVKWPVFMCSVVPAFSHGQGFIWCR